MNVGAGKREGFVEVDAEMLKVMKRLNDFNLGTPSMRSLAGLRSGAKKRKRADFESDFQIQAVIKEA